MNLRVCQYLVLSVFLVGCCLAQSDSGSLAGVVSDPSGAFVPGAEVSLRNQATSAVRHTLTEADGFYQFPLIAPGSYEVAVSAKGFRRFTASNLPVQVSQAAKLDVPLALEASAESVAVTDTVSMLTTDTVSSGTTITGEKILALPLNGREFIKLALLAPGANSGGRQVQQNSARLNQTGGFSSSGGRTNNNLFLLDGAINTDPDYNALSYVPIVDSLAEFQVQGFQYGAQYGRASGAQINAVTKSGSNDFHGSVWEFLRNQTLDARPFNSVSSKLQKNQRNQFGGMVAGPVLKNKLFFAGAYEGLRLRQAGVGITEVLVPTELERRGDFSRSTPAMFDPDTLTAGTRNPFPGDVIPPSRINPITSAAINAAPLPNTGTNRFVNGNAVLRQDSDNYSLRSDYTISEKMALFGRYSTSNENSVTPDVIPNRDRIGEVRPQNSVAGLNTVFNASTVNELRVGYNRLYFQDGMPEPLFDVIGQRRTIPRFRPNGYAVLGGAGAFTGTTGGGTVLSRNNTYQIYDNLARMVGRHSLKVGGEVLRVNFNRSEAAAPQGDFQFLQGYTSGKAANDGTGNVLATMLLALPNQGSRQVTPTRIDGQQYAGAAYVQDDIRVNRKLTLNAGLRYEIAPPMADTREQLAGIDFRNLPSPRAIFAEGRLGYYRPTLFTCGLGGYPAGCAYTDKNNFAPRLGLAWTPIEKTVIRIGGGIFYALVDNNGFLQLARGLPTNISQNLNAASNFVPSFRGFDIFGSSAEVGKVALSQATLDLFQRTSYSPQVSFAVEREITKNTVVEASYLMTLGIKLQQNVQPNNAQPGAGAVDPRRPYGGVNFAPSMVFPYYITPVATWAPVTQVNVYANSAQSNYHALLLRFERRYSGGLSWLSSYTFSKAITNAPQFRNAGGANGSENSPPQDSYNLRAERGLASFDQRHRWVNSFVYDLPFAKGWKLASILQLQSGFPFTINVSGDTAGIGGGTGGILIRPNAVPGESYYLDPSQRSSSRFFNTSAFALTPAYQFGNVGRNTVTGPGMFNIDTTVARQFRILERYTLQFRAEFFNLLNTPNHNMVGRLINVPDTFGRVLNQLDPRQIQFALRLSF